MQKRTATRMRVRGSREMDEKIAIGQTPRKSDFMITFSMDVHFTVGFSVVISPR